MNKQGRNESGKFAAKSNENRQVRSIRLTDTTWNALGKLADEQSITRADLVENWMDREYFELEEKVKQLELELQIIKSSSIQFSVDVLESLDKLVNERSITREELIIDLLNNQQLDNKILNPTQLDLLPDSMPAVEINKSIQPLNNSALAKRLGVDPSNLSKYKDKGDEKVFLYTMSKDPEGLAWIYIKFEKLYYPVIR